MFQEDLLQRLVLAPFFLYQFYRLFSHDLCYFRCFQTFLCRKTYITNGATKWLLSFMNWGDMWIQTSFWSEKLFLFMNCINVSGEINFLWTALTTNIFLMKRVRQRWCATVNSKRRLTFQEIVVLWSDGRELWHSLFKKGTSNMGVSTVYCVTQIQLMKLLVYWKFIQNQTSLLMSFFAVKNQRLFAKTGTRCHCRRP